MNQSVPTINAKDQFYQVLSKMTPFNALKGHFEVCLKNRHGLLVVKIKMTRGCLQVWPRTNPDKYQPNITPLLPKTANLVFGFLYYLGPLVTKNPNGP